MMKRAVRGHRPRDEEGGRGVRFLHTSDWQLGMTRHFFDADGAARFAAAREDAIRRIGEVAVRHACQFVVVAGDVFESNFVEPRTVRRACEALATVAVPVYLLPGNHDPLDPGSLYRSREFGESCPPHVRVLEPGQTEVPVPGVEVVGAVWKAKRQTADLLGELCDRLAPVPAGVLRVVVGHGQMDTLVPEAGPDTIRFGVVERAVREGRVHYVALGDRHSTTPVGETRRIWYSGAPEPTDYDERDPGNVLVVDLMDRSCRVLAEKIGTWHFVETTLELTGEDPAGQVRRWLTAIADKTRTVVKLGLRGTITVRDRILVEEVIERERQVFAAIERPRHHDELAVRAGDQDLAELGLSGYAREALAVLVGEAAGDGAAAKTAEGALALLYRLAGGGRPA